MFDHFSIRCSGSGVVQIVSIPDICLLPYFLYSHKYRLTRNTVYCAILNRKFHISQISHRVKNWYQFFTFGKCEICVWSILIILGVYNLCSNFTYFSFLVRICAICEGLVRFFSDVKNWYSIFTNVKNWYQFFTPVKNWYVIFTNVKSQYQMLTDVKNWYQFFTDVKKLVPNFHRCEELVLNLHRCQWQKL